MEAAALTREAIDKGGKHGAMPDATWAKVKFDRQIVAIARAVGATTIYTNDDQLSKHARAIGITAFKPDDLPEPPVSPQIELQLDPIAPEQPPDDDAE